MRGWVAYVMPHRHKLEKEPEALTATEPGNKPVGATSTSTSTVLSFGVLIDLAVEAATLCTRAQVSLGYRL